MAIGGMGATMLATREANGHWGRGFYQPKWTSSHYTLSQLREIALSPTCPAARATVGLILDAEKADDGGLNPSGRRRPSAACGHGMALGYAY